MVFIVGLTGGIGSGKSSAGHYFSALGIDVIDTDQIAQELTQPQGPAIIPIKNRFGDDFITADGALDRKKMRSQIFSNSASRQKLETILHPLIREEVSRRIALTRSCYIIIMIPLLFETTDYHHMIQRILVIDCDEQDQITRTMARSQLTQQTIYAIMATQISRQERLQKADDIITNNQDMAYLKKQVIDLHKKYLMLSKQHPATQPIS